MTRERWWEQSGGVVRDDALREIRETLERIEVRLAHVQAVTRMLYRMEVTMAGELQALQDQVAQNTSVEQSAIVLINGIAQKLADAIAAGADPAVLTALKDQLQASSTALAAAVTANTPANP